MTGMEIEKGLARGMRWAVPPQDSVLHRTGAADSFFQFAMSRFLEGGDVFYDVGASLGYYTLMAANQVGREGQVVAIEPHPDQVSHLKANLRENKLDNVTVVQKALCEETKEVVLSAGADLDLASLGVQGSGLDSLSVSGITLDELVCSLRRPNVVKVDVEGAENRVLRGAGETLGLGTVVFLVELHDPESAVEVFQVLRAHGYVLSSHEPVDAAMLAALHPQSKILHLVAVPGGRGTGLLTGVGHPL